MQTPPRKQPQTPSNIDLDHLLTTPTIIKVTHDVEPPTTPQSQSQYIWRCRCCNSTQVHTPSSTRKHTLTPKTPRQRDFDGRSPSKNKKKQGDDRIKSTPGKSSLLVASPAADNTTKINGAGLTITPSTPSKRQHREILTQASPPRDLPASRDERPFTLEPIMEIDDDREVSPTAGSSSLPTRAFEMDVDGDTHHATPHPSGPFHSHLNLDLDPGTNLTPDPLIASLLASSDPSDSISHTLPIYLTSSLSPSLQLVQYPLHHRPLTVSPYAQSKGHTITARMKEVVERFELEVPVDMREEVWDEEKAEEMGFQGAGSGGVKEEKKKMGSKSGGTGGDGWGGKMRLRSEEVPHVTGYWSGIVHDHALYIHPINKLIQLRPSLGYLDDLDKKKRTEEARRKRRGGPGGGDDESGDEDEDDVEDGPGGATGGKKKGTGTGGDELKSVTMQLASLPSLSHDSETRRTTKMGTGGTIGLTSQIRARIVKALKQEMEDVWKPWNWVDGDLDEVGEALDKLILLPDEHKTVLKCQTTNLDFISRKNIGEGAKLPN